MPASVARPNVSPALLRELKGTPQYLESASEQKESANRPVRFLISSSSLLSLLDSLNTSGTSQSEHSVPFLLLDALCSPWTPIPGLPPLHQLHPAAGNLARCSPQRTPQSPLNILTVPLRHPRRDSRTRTPLPRLVLLHLSASLPRSSHQLIMDSAPPSTSLPQTQANIEHNQRALEARRIREEERTIAREERKLRVEEERAKAGALRVGVLCSTKNRRDAD